MAEEEGTTALAPQAERVNDFYGDPIAVALGPDGDLYVPIRTIAEFLGLDWSSQYKRIQRDEVLTDRGRMVTVTGTDGRPRPMFSLPLDLLPGWLFGITASRARPELAPKLRQYRQECFRVLWRAFESEIMPSPPPATTNGSLAQVRDLALAVARMAEQQMALEGRVIAIRGEVGQVTEQQRVVHVRLDKAAGVIKSIEQRLGAVERRIDGDTAITDAQAAEVSMAVKSIAQALSIRESGKNQYQGVFAELYRRFQVTSYKHIRQDQFTDVMAFLDEWAATASSDNRLPTPMAPVGE